MKCDSCHVCTYIPQYGSDKPDTRYDMKVRVLQYHTTKTNTCIYVCTICILMHVCVHIHVLVHGCVL